jgi:hypothetical protein
LVLAQADSRRELTASIMNEIGTGNGQNFITVLQKIKEMVALMFAAEVVALLKALIEGFQ